mmetsp:Transcript_42588/g.110006  ORF Transcript_42588/g.110006 Transcript_42588/m.110006 type:complete len:277 (-) Transcript_42588:1478-2308(-)
MLLRERPDLGHRVPRFRHEAAKDAVQLLLQGLGLLALALDLAMTHLEHVLRRLEALRLPDHAPLHVALRGGLEADMVGIPLLEGSLQPADDHVRAASGGFEVSYLYVEEFLGAGQLVQAKVLELCALLERRHALRGEEEGVIGDHGAHLLVQHRLRLLQQRRGRGWARVALRAALERGLEDHRLRCHRAWKATLHRLALLLTLFLLALRLQLRAPLVHVRGVLLQLRLTGGLLLVELRHGDLNLIRGRGQAAQLRTHLHRLLRPLQLQGHGAVVVL